MATLLLLSACSGGGDGATADTVPSVDNIPPAITINDHNPVNIVLGTPYSDAGATASDMVDGNVAVTTSGTVDTATEGSYTITYSATDGAGNSATATRVVYVDGTAPVITVIGDNPLGVAIGAIYTDAGATAADTLDGNVAITTSGAADTATEGVYTMVYTAIDRAGNDTTAMRTVYVDGTAPVITMNGDNPLSVALGSIYADAGATAVDAVDGNVAVSASGTVDTGTEGSYTISYSATDSVGNTATTTRTIDVKQPLFTFSTQEAREPLLNVKLGNIGGGIAWEVALSHDGRTAYITTQGTSQDILRIVDVSDPAAPRSLATYDISSTATTVTLSSDDRTAFIADLNAGLHIVDVSNPASPYLLATYNTIGAAYHVTLSSDGSKAYVADGGYGLRIVDISDPASPGLLGTYHDAFSSGGAKGVVLAGDGNTAYVADGATGLTIVNVSNPASPSLSGSYDTVDARDVALSSDGRTAYVADDFTGLQIIDVSDPEAPAYLGKYNTSSLASGVALSDDGNIAYVADFLDGLQIIDVSDPGAPALLGRYDTDVAMAVTLSRDGSIAYIADNEAGLKIIDISNPASPTLLGSYDTTGFALDVALSTDGRRAFVADDVSGLHIIDVTDPASPIWRGTYDTIGYSSGVMPSSDSSTAYLADSHGGLKILDISQDSLYKGKNFGNSHVKLRIQSNVQIPLNLQLTADRSDIITVNPPLTLDYVDYNEQDVQIPISSITNAGGWTELTITLSYGAQTTSRKVYVWVIKV